MDAASPHHAVLARARAHLNQLDKGSVAATATKEELRARLGRPLTQEGTDAVRVIDELVADSAGGWLGSAGGRFFAWVVGGSLPAALAADWLTSTWDQPSALYACGPAVAVIEEVCGAWLKDLLGLPHPASFALTSGCQMSHATCLAAARHHLLAVRAWDVERQGLFGAPRIQILTGEHRHGSIDRAVRLLGLGTEAVVDLPVDRGERLTPQALAAALREQSEVLKIVLLQAGEINTGSFDPFAELIPLAHAHHAWVHIDGAFGLWAGASRTLRRLLAGVDQADSWSVDGHKWLNVPYDCGYAFVAHPAAHRAAMAHQASYLTHANDDARDQIDWNPEWSRRGRGMATYAALRQLGRDGVAELLERCCRCAKELAAGIGALPGAEIVWEPVLNQGLVRFRDPGPGAGEHDHARRTDEVMENILRGGEASFSGTTWRGLRCMRISVCNWRTDSAEVRRAIAAVAAALQSGQVDRFRGGDASC